MYKTNSKAIRAFIMIILLLCSVTSFAQSAAARSATDADNKVFLGGRFIEFGIGQNGSSGVLANNTVVPTGFFGRKTNFAGGFLGDADGFGSGIDLRIDYFLPGTPAEGWAVAIGASNANNSNSTTGITGYTFVDATVGNTLRTTGTGTWSSLQIDHDISFNVAAKAVRYDVTLTNTSGSAMANVAYMRSFDPDNTKDQGGTHTTVNTVVADFATDGKVIVEALSEAGDAYDILAGTQSLLRYYSEDARALPRLLPSGLMDTSARDAVDNPTARGTTETADKGITIAFNIGTINVGASTSFTFYVVMRSENGSVTTPKNVDFAFLNYDFNYLDPTIPLSGATVSSLPANGTLYLDANDNGIIDAGEDITAPELPISLTVSDLDILKFKPTTDWTGQTSFNFRSNGVGDTILMAVTVSEPWIISGRITNNSVGLAGVELVGFPETTLTDANGDYSAEVVNGWGGVITPTLATYAFTPASRSYNAVAANQTNQDYTVNPYTISGTVTDGSAPISGVTITFSHNSATTTTIANGTFSYSVPNGTTTTLTPSHPGYASFSPVNLTVTNIKANTPNQNFVGTPNMYTISGTVTDGSNPSAGVTITFSHNSHTETTAADGTYSYTVPYGTTTTITPSHVGYASFSPVTRTVTTIAANTPNQNFVGTPNNYTISGTVTDGSNPSAGVTITFSHNSHTETTAANGTYSYTVPNGTTTTLTPTHVGYASWSPATRTITAIAANATNQNFTGTRNNYTISGTVSDGSNPIAGVTITFSHNSHTLTTDASGNYSYAVPYETTTTITPSRAGYASWTPATRTITTIAANAPNQNFTGTRSNYTISGTVTDGSNPIAGVTITFSHNSHSETTAANGTYSYAVPYETTTTVTPSHPGYDVFTPVNRTITSIAANATNQNFTGTRNNYTISGTVSDGSNPIAGVTITFSHNSHSETTAADGTYSYAVPYGTTTTITPNHDDYASFTPENRTVTSISVNTPNQNFTGTIRSFTVTAVVDGANGSVSPASQVINLRERAVINIMPRTGYRIATIIDNGVAASISNPYVIDSVERNHHVSVRFINNPPQVTIIDPIEGSTVFGQIIVLARIVDDIGVVDAELLVSDLNGNKKQHISPDPEPYISSSRHFIPTGMVITEDFKFKAETGNLFIDEKDKLRQILPDGSLLAVLTPDLDVSHLQSFPQQQRLVITFKDNQTDSMGNSGTVILFDPKNEQCHAMLPFGFEAIPFAAMIKPTFTPLDDLTYFCLVKDGLTNKILNYQWSPQTGRLYPKEIPEGVITPDIHDDLELEKEKPVQQMDWMQEESANADPFMSTLQSPSVQIQAPTTEDDDIWTFSWNSEEATPGPFRLTVVAWDEANARGQDTVELNIASFSIELQAVRMTAESWSYDKDFGQIDITPEITGLSIGEYRILRQTDNGEFIILTRFTPQQMVNGTFSYQDKYFEKGKIYTYRIDAYDSQGRRLGASPNRTI